MSWTGFLLIFGSEAAIASFTLVLSTCTKVFPDNSLPGFGKHFKRFGGMLLNSAVVKPLRTPLASILHCLALLGEEDISKLGWAEGGDNALFLVAKVLRVVGFTLKIFSSFFACISIDCESSFSLGDPERELAVECGLVLLDWVVIGCGDSVNLGERRGKFSWSLDWLVLSLIRERGILITKDWDSPVTAGRGEEPKGRYFPGDTVDVFGDFVCAKWRSFVGITLLERGRYCLPPTSKDKNHICCFSPNTNLDLEFQTNFDNRLLCNIS